MKIDIGMNPEKKVGVVSFGMRDNKEGFVFSPTFYFIFLVPPHHSIKVLLNKSLAVLIKGNREIIKA